MLVLVLRKRLPTLPTSLLRKQCAQLWEGKHGVCNLHRCRVLLRGGPAIAAAANSERLHRMPVLLQGAKAGQGSTQRVNANGAAISRGL